MSFLLATKPVTAASAPPGWELVRASSTSTCKSKDETEKDQQTQRSASSAKALAGTPEQGTTALVRPLRMVHPRVSRKHPKYGMLDCYTTILTYVNGATSDASGNLPGFFPVSNITATGGWASFATSFDLVRLRKVVYHWRPKLGWKVARSFNPLTATACQVLRIREDPDGALGSPTISQVLQWVPNKSRKLGGACEDHSLVDAFSFEYSPRQEILRSNSASGLDLRNLHDWVDVGDINLYASSILCGGITYNVLQAGACPASTDVFSITMLYHVEFALRAN